MESNHIASSDEPNTTIAIIPTTPTATTSQDTKTAIISSTLLCWGCGEFGQHCHGHKGDVGFRRSEVKRFGSSAALGVISHISCGASHTAAVTDSGEIYTWGNGNSGQLGCGDQEPRWEPTAVSLSPPPPKGCRIRTLACGSRHTMVVLDNGYVHSFGNNFYAQLGYNFRDKNYKENQIRPHFLEFLKHRPVRSVECGDKHSLFLFEDGTVAAVGTNAHGQIGDGSRDESAVPKAVELEEKVRYIACGLNHNMVITESGDVYAWGYGKACGKRRHDVMTPQLMAFKGREVVQVAGGSTHSLALTAGGKVYSWGFGMDGQLGLGSVVMATRPRRLRHSFLDEGASSVACGDTLSAVITGSGRLYMWGRNSHTIQEGMGSLHKVREPLCMNPEPSAPVHHVVCGAWHAAALTGKPDVVLMPEEEESEPSDDENSSNKSVYSTVSSANTDEATNGLPHGPQGGGLGSSAPPHSTTSTTPRGPTSVQPPPFLVARGKTKLTIGEFYATSESASSSEKASKCSTTRGFTTKPSENNPKPTEPKSSEPQHSTTAVSPHQSRVTPLVVEVPSVVLDPDSDVEEPLKISTKEEMMMEDEHFDINEYPTKIGDGPEDLDQEGQINGNALPTLVLPRDSACSDRDKREEEQNSSRRSTNSKSADSAYDWPPVSVRESLGELESKVQELHSSGERGGTGEDGTRGGGGKGGGSNPPTGHPSGGPRSRTGFISTPHSTVQVSRNSAKNFSLPRERSMVASKNMDILDASQLLTGASGVPGSAKTGASPSTVFTPGRPYGADKGTGGLGYFTDIFGAFPPGFDTLDDYDFDYLEASPRAFTKDMTLQRVPTVQLEGDFGEIPDEATSKPRSEEKPSRSRSTLTSRDLDWIDQLLLQKTVSQGPRNVKRSATFFGALSGQVSRSPTKFFRKPTPSGHFQSRTTTPATHSTTPAPHTPFSRTLTHLGLGGGTGGGGGGGSSGGSGGKGGDSPRRPSTRGLGAIGGEAGKNLGRSKSQRAPTSSTIPVSRPENQDSKKQPSKNLYFSSATSWRQRRLDLPEDLFDDSKSQSAPTSSKTAGRKHVAFADQRTSSGAEAPRSPPAKSGLASTAAVAGSPLPKGHMAGRSDLVAEKSGVPTTHDGGTNYHGDGGGNRKSQHHLTYSEIHGQKSSKNTRQAPTLSYRTANKKDSSDSTVSRQPPSLPKSGGQRTLPGNARVTASTFAANAKRSRSHTEMSGRTVERSRKTQFN